MVKKIFLYVYRFNRGLLLPLCLIMLLVGLLPTIAAQSTKLITPPSKPYCLAPGIGITKISTNNYSWYAWNLHIHASYKKIYLNYNYSAQKELRIFSSRFDNVTQIRSFTTGYKYQEKWFSFLVGGGIADIRQNQSLQSPGVTVGGNSFTSLQSNQNSLHLNYSLIFESQLLITGEKLGLSFRLFNMSGPNASVPYGFSVGLLAGKLR